MPDTETNPRAALRDALIDFDSALQFERGGVVQRRTVAEAQHLADVAERLLAWMDGNGIDPGDPPSCGCGGYHWSCPGPDAEDEDDEPETCRQCCTETEGLADVQGTLLCQGCIAYNVSRCM